MNNLKNFLRYVSDRTGFKPSTIRKWLYEKPIPPSCYSVVKRALEMYEGEIGERHSRVLRSKLEKMSEVST